MNHLGGLQDILENDFKLDVTDYGRYYTFYLVDEELRDGEFVEVKKPFYTIEFRNDYVIVGIHGDRPSFRKYEMAERYREALRRLFKTQFGYVPYGRYTKDEDKRFYVTKHLPFYQLEKTLARTIAFYMDARRLTRQSMLTFVGSDRNGSIFGAVIRYDDGNICVGIVNKAQITSLQAKLFDRLGDEPVELVTPPNSFEQYAENGTLVACDGDKPEEIKTKE